MKQVIEYEVEKLELDNGVVPFDKWYHSIKDVTLRATVMARLARLRAGNLGNYRSLKEGVYELKINAGGGLRIYFAFHKKSIVLLLGGGNKRTQKQDIVKSIVIWSRFKNENKEI